MTKMSIQNVPQGLSISGSKPKTRVPRRPKHTFHIKTYGYEISPFMFAPVLPGETLKNLLLQTRCVSVPLESTLIGHWLEHYFFYVKLTDLDDYEDIKTMLMDATAASVTTEGADNQYLFAKSGAIAWQQMCLDRIVAEYFRDEGDAESVVGSTTGLPFAYMDKSGFMDSFILDSAIQTDNINTDTADMEFDEFEKEFATYQMMRQNQLTELDFYEWLGSFGVRVSDDERPRKPELIRFFRDFSYPTNTVSGDGSINTQMSWSVQGRADKDRFFKEHGFIVGVTVQRPKIYLGHQVQSAISLLDGALAWLPANLKEQTHISLQQINSGDAKSPFESTLITGTGTADYWLDVRDLFVHGDMFQNMGTITASEHHVDCYSNSFHGKKYPKESDILALGASTTNLSYEHDGVVSLNIMGTQQDYT